MRDDFWAGKKVLVTGGSGMVGSCISKILLELNSDVFITVYNKDYSKIRDIKNKIKIYKNCDLRNLDGANKALKNKDIVLHLAAKVAGINYNRKHPGTMFRDNMLINSNVLDAAVSNKIERILVVSSACVYPRDCQIPTPESEGFVGVPEPTNDGYGWAKRMLEFQAQAYNKEFSLKVAIARPYNCYGPRDNFNVETAHVIPSIIRRIYAGENPLKVWGTGEQSRSFLYVEDFARGLLEITEKCPCADPINLGTDEEIKIRDLVKLIIKLTNKDVKIIFDKSKPDGQPRRVCDITKCKRVIGFAPKVNLIEGLKRTIEWYKMEVRHEK
jgi:GDP-L-fucose synthase